MTKKADHVMTPGKGDRVSVRHLSQTTEERKRQLKEFREDQAHKQALKEERYARIEAERKKRGGNSRGGKNINIEVTSDS